MYNVIIIMKLSIYKTNNRYAFSIDGFSSTRHSCLFLDVKPTYQYAWQAYRKAKSLAFNRGFHIEAIHKYALEDLSKPVRAEETAEDILINHYKTMLVEMSKKVKGIDDDPEKDKELTYLMIVSQVDDLLRIKENIESDKYDGAIDEIINEHRKIVQAHFSDYLRKDKKEKEEAAAQPPMPPDMQPEIPNVPPMEEGAPETPNMTMASVKKTIKLTEDELAELLEHYGLKTCEAITKSHPDAISKINIDDRSCNIISLDSGDAILKITVNDNINVNNIIPTGNLVESCPSFSPKFYQRYWKPIVESLGHFFLDDLDSLIIPQMGALPDIPNGDGKFDIRGWNPKELKEVPLSMSFKEETPMWVIANSESRLIKMADYSEEDFLRTQPTRVRCTDQRLQLFDSIGEVVQVIPVNSGVGFEVDVNFGRKVVRLSQQQVEIINDL